MITAETYLRILRDRLEEANIDDETIAKTVSREKATIAGVSEEDVASLFTEQRLSVLISSAVRRSVKKVNPTKDEYGTRREESTLVTHNSSDQDGFDTAATISVEKTRLPIENDSDDKTIVHKSPDIPRVLIESDTATVVISEPPIKPKSHESCDVLEKTVVQKLLSDTATVRISEKDTMQFLTLAPDKNETPSFDSTGETIDIPTTKTNPSLEGDQSKQTVQNDDDVLIPSFLEDAHGKKKEILQNTAKPSASSDLIIVSESDLKNRHPGWLLLMVLITLFPLISVLLTLYSVLFSVTFAFLALLTAIPILFYTVAVSGTGGGIIYGGFCIVRSFMNTDHGNHVTPFLIFFASLAIFVLSIRFLHRLTIPLFTYFRRKLQALWHKNTVFCRNVLRYLFKSIRHA